MADTDTLDNTNSNNGFATAESNNTSNISENPKPVEPNHVNEQYIGEDYSADITQETTLKPDLSTKNVISDVNTALNTTLSNNDVTNKTTLTDEEMQQNTRYKTLLKELEQLEQDQINVYDALESTDTSELTTDINKFLGLDTNDKSKLDNTGALAVACDLACTIKKYELMLTKLESSEDKETAMLLLYAKSMQVPDIYQTQEITQDNFIYLLGCFNKFIKFSRANHHFMTTTYNNNNNKEKNKVELLINQAKDSNCDISSFENPANVKEPITQSGLILDPRNILIPKNKPIEIFFKQGMSGICENGIMHKHKNRNDICFYSLLCDKVYIKYGKVYNKSKYESFKDIIDQEKRTSLLNLKLPFPGSNVEKFSRVGSVLKGFAGGGLLSLGLTAGVTLVLYFVFPPAAVVISGISSSVGGASGVSFIGGFIGGLLGLTKTPKQHSINSVASQTTRGKIAEPEPNIEPTTVEQKPKVKKLYSIFTQLDKLIDQEPNTTQNKA